MRGKAARRTVRITVDEAGKWSFPELNKAQLDLRGRPPRASGQPGDADASDDDAPWGELLKQTEGGRRKKSTFTFERAPFGP